MDLFIPVSDDILMSNKTLTRNEIDLIQNSVEQSSAIIALCGERDADVMHYHQVYLSKCINRVEHSIRELRAIKASKLGNKSNGILQFRRR